MAEKEYFINDNIVIPEWINKMTSEERHAEIERLEKIAKAEKERILNQN
ncbi:MAG: hypothetical protein IJ446_04565 [Oscillospiraceae bacterium]|nr:hypothetical protein [Oscillospiraceae bacterium]